MRKILMGLMAIVLIAGVTTATGYAVFTATATVNNVAFTTGTAGLQFAPNNNGVPGTYSSSYTFPTYLVTNVFPGYTSGTQYVWVENTSSSNISLALSAQLVSATGDWGVLNSVANMSIGTVSGPLVNWNGADVPLNVTLTPGQQMFLPVVFSISSSAGNEISGKSLITNWVITGTQTP